MIEYVTVNGFLWTCPKGHSNAHIERYEWCYDDCEGCWYIICDICGHRENV